MVETATVPGAPARVAEGFGGAAGGAAAGVLVQRLEALGDDAWWTLGDGLQSIQDWSKL